MLAAKIIASCFGIGYIKKGAGSVAALFYCLFWYLVSIGDLSIAVQSALLLFLFAAGVYAASAVENVWGHDSNRVVIDEVFGMLVTLTLVPHDWRYLAVGFLLFRFFDIAKPFGIRKMEAFPKGWGVMLDDLLAALYSSLFLQVIIKSNLFS